MSMKRNKYQIEATVKNKIIVIGVLGLAPCHADCEIEIASTFTPPCCLVFVGQERQSWVPGPLQAYNQTKEVEVLHLFRWYTHTQLR